MRHFLPGSIVFANSAMVVFGASRLRLGIFPDACCTPSELYVQNQTEFVKEKS